MALSNNPPSDLFAKHLHGALNATLEEAAEPMIKEAVAKFEQQLRAKLGSLLIATLQQNLRIYERENTLVIELRQAKE